MALLRIGPCILEVVEGGPDGAGGIRIVLGRQDVQLSLSTRLLPGPLRLAARSQKSGSRTGVWS